MRNIHLLEQFMRENGLEYDVPFVVETTGYLGEKELRELEITKSDEPEGFELNYANRTKQMGNSLAAMQELMFSDRFKIIKKPWKPKYKEQYYFINACGDVMPDVFYNDVVIDNYRYLLGNCFKTEIQAEKHKNDVLKVLNGEPFVKWED